MCELHGESIAVAEMRRWRRVSIGTAVAKKRESAHENVPLPFETVESLSRMRELRARQPKAVSFIRTRQRRFERRALE